MGKKGVFRHRLGPVPPRCRLTPTENLAQADMVAIGRLLENGARYPMKQSELNTAAVGRLRKLGLVAKIGEVCILAKRESISKCIA